MAADSNSARLRYEPLVVVAIALAAGIVLDRHGLTRLESHRFAAWWWLSITLLVGWLWAWRNRNDAVAAWLLLAVVAIAGAAWHDLRWREFSRVEIARYAELEAEPSCTT